LREVKIRSDEILSIHEQFDKVLKYLGNVTFTAFTSKMKTYPTYNIASDIYNRFDCTGLVLSLLANEREFEIITGRETIPSIETIEQVLTCKFIPMQRKNDYIFIDSLKDFITDNGVYIGGIITQPHHGTNSHIMLLIVAKDDEHIFMSVFDPQRTGLENAQLYNVNHDSRFVLLDKMFRNAEKVFCTFFGPNDTRKIDLRSVLKQIQPLGKTCSYSQKRVADQRTGLENISRRSSQTHRRERNAFAFMNRRNLYTPTHVSRNNVNVTSRNIRNRSGGGHRSRSRSGGRGKYRSGGRSRSRNRSEGGHRSRSGGRSRSRNKHPTYVKYKH
jgi:hypothetical protein